MTGCYQDWIDLLDEINGFFCRRVATGRIAASCSNTRLVSGGRKQEFFIYMLATVIPEEVLTHLQVTNLIDGIVVEIGRVRARALDDAERHHVAALYSGSGQ